MTLARARIIKAGVSAHGSTHAGTTGTSAGASDDVTRVTDAGARLARRIPAMVVLAKEEAESIVRDARAKAESILAEGRATVAAVVQNAATDAREAEVARVCAELLVRRATEEEDAERELDRTIDLAVLLAERLVGEAIAVEPSRVGALAVDALREARGAREIRIEACAEDVPVLKEMVSELGAHVARVEASTDLARGSLVVHTELGRIDGRLAPQLSRLAGALRTALRDAKRNAR